MSYWVLIETGSNQEFIFRSDRQRFHVGASTLIADVRHWIDNAVRGTSAEVVVSTSSKALLLVDDPAVGRRIVTAVTRTALKTAPGLDIWGYVETEASPEAPMTRLPAVHAAHAKARYQRPTPTLRAPMAPFLDLCTLTGLPSSEWQRRPGNGTTYEGISTVAHAVLSRADRAIHHDRAWDRYGAAVLSDQREEILNAGWVAIVHADGNGIGRLIREIDDVAAFREVSRELEEATTAALSSAVTSAGQALSTVRGKEATDWFLPLIVGGDDVTVVCDARVGVELTRSYLKAFEASTGRAARLSPLASKVFGRDYLTASAGIAFVKPTYPFHAGYDLAEELCGEAKVVKTRGDQDRGGLPVSSYDLHVLHDSIRRPLSQIRETQTADWADVGAVRLTASPLIPSGYQTLEGLSAVDQKWLETHDDALMLAAVEGLALDRVLSSSALHDLRAAMIAGGAELTRTRERVTARAEHPADAHAFLDTHLQVDESETTSFSRLLTAMEMADLARGRADGERVSHAQEVPA